MGIHSSYRRQRLCDTQEKNITEVNIISAYGKGLKINGLAICKDQAVHHIDTYHKVKPYGLIKDSASTLTLIKISKAMIMCQKIILILKNLN